eukprot:gene8433-5911_t
MEMDRVGSDSKAFLAVIAVSAALLFLLSVPQYTSTYLTFRMFYQFVSSILPLSYFFVCSSLYCCLAAFCKKRAVKGVEGLALSPGPALKSFGLELDARRRVLITGGAGYIGSFVVRHLLQRSTLPVAVLDNLNFGKRAAQLPWWENHVGFSATSRPVRSMTVGDCGDPGVLDRVFTSAEPIVAVLHLAASTVVSESVADPLRYYHNNLTSTVEVLRAMQRHGCRRIIFSSSCTVGAEERSPTTGAPCGHPYGHPYGETKQWAEKMIQRCCEAYGFQSVALRFFNAAGASGDGNLGEVHDPETHIIPLLLQAHLRGSRCEGRGSKGNKQNISTRGSFSVYGTDYPTRDGTCVRDYIHVEDLAVAYGLALDYLLKQKADSGGFTVIELGTGCGSSVKDVLQAAEAVTGSRVAVQYEARRPGDVPELVADPSTARLLLGWEPKRSLIDILSTAWSVTLERDLRSASVNFDIPSFHLREYMGSGTGFFRMQARSARMCRAAVGCSLSATLFCRRFIKYRSLPADDPFGERSTWEDPGEGVFAGWKDVPSEQFTAAADSDEIRQAHFGPEWARFSTVGKMSVEKATRNPTAKVISAEEKNTARVRARREMLETRNYHSYEEYLDHQLGSSDGDDKAPSAPDASKDNKDVQDDDREPPGLPGFMKELRSAPPPSSATEGVAGEKLAKGSDPVPEEVRRAVYAGLPERFRCSPLSLEDPLQWGTADIIMFLRCFVGEVMDETMISTFTMANVTGHTLLNVVAPPRLFSRMRRWHVARQRVAAKVWSSMRDSASIGADVPTSLVEEVSTAMLPQLEASIADLTPDIVQETILLCFPYGYGRT